MRLASFCPILIQSSKLKEREREKEKRDVNTDMSKMAMARLHELAPAAKGNQCAVTRNLACAFFDMPVELF